MSTPYSLLYTWSEYGPGTAFMYHGLARFFCFGGAIAEGVQEAVGEVRSGEKWMLILSDYLHLERRGTADVARVCL